MAARCTMPDPQRPAGASLSSWPTEYDAANDTHTVKCPERSYPVAGSALSGFLRLDTADDRTDAWMKALLDSVVGQPFSIDSRHVVRSVPTLR